MRLVESASVVCVMRGDRMEMNVAHLCPRSADYQSGVQQGPGKLQTRLHQTQLFSIALALTTLGTQQLIFAGELTLRSSDQRRASDK